MKILDTAKRVLDLAAQKAAKQPNIRAVDFVEVQYAATAYTHAPALANAVLELTAENERLIELYELSKPTKPDGPNTVTAYLAAQESKYPKEWTESGRGPGKKSYLTLAEEIMHDGSKEQQSLFYDFLASRCKLDVLKNLNTSITKASPTNEDHGSNS